MIFTITILVFGIRSHFYATKYPQKFVLGSDAPPYTSTTFVPFPKIIWTVAVSPAVILHNIPIDCGQFPVPIVPKLPFVKVMAVVVIDIVAVIVATACCAKTCADSQYLPVTGAVNVLDAKLESISKSSVSNETVADVPSPVTLAVGVLRYALKAG